MLRQVSLSKQNSTCTHTIVIVPEDCVSGSNRVPYKQLIQFDNKIAVHLMHRKTENAALFCSSKENLKRISSYVFSEREFLLDVQRGVNLYFLMPNLCQMQIYSQNYIHTLILQVDPTPGTLYVIPTTEDQCIFIAFPKHAILFIDSCCADLVVVIYLHLTKIFSDF